MAGWVDLSPAVGGGEKIGAKRLRASRRCSDCVHLDTGIGVQKEFRLWCRKNRWEREDPTSAFLASALRTAATCPDYEAVDE